MKKLAYMTIVALLFISCGVTKEQEEFTLLLSEAEELYKKALESEEPEKTEFFFRSAVLLENALEQQDLNNGYIYYNIANSWLMSGDTGRAILNYRKALERLPSNTLIKENLALARSSVPLLIDRDPINPLIRAIFFIHYDISFGGRVVILIVILFFLFGSASILLFYKMNYIRNFLFFLAVVAIIISISLIEEIQRKPEGVILTEIDGRKGDSSGYEKSFTESLSPGIEFKLLETRSGWMMIELMDKRHCWIPEAAAEIIK